MKFPATLNKFLPKAMRSDTRAVQDFIKKERKRISMALQKRRTFVATMQMDELKLAVQWAKDPERPRRDTLYPIYDEVWENDGHTIGETRKAILKVVGSPFAVFKAGTQEIDELATRLLQKKWFEEYRKHFQETNFWGHSLVQFIEMKPSNVKGMKFEFSKIELIDRYHVRPEEGFIVIDTSHETGIPFRDPVIKKSLMLIEMGDAKYLGLLRVASKEYIWKNYSRSDWSRHSEKFGMPFLNIRTATTDKRELDEIESMASNFGNNLYYIGDIEDEIEIKEATFKNSYQIYKELASFSNSEISKAISGATGTSDEKAFVGSAEVHEDILNEFVEANKRAETYHVNEDLFPFLIEHGYPLADREFRYISYQDGNPDAEEKEDKNKGGGGRPEKKSRRPSPNALFR